ncbi:DUF86 domain-containing protein [Bacillus sp. CECT 9360]|uniref:DUF86 domain-containing protein n=1 Tax=Bacillus sp. CECT 9360 TaxID=2845821 RepID=UPI001E2E7D62|nr:DUF86 domain-containing protein [Bacillus sp. CECT 9360]CAH0344658.1 hypothetical protein BCI9360_00918 [Bacillus sp. CECT 9360]
MYFVDRQKIEQILNYLEQQLDRFENNPEWENDLARLALERIVQTSLDAVLDAGNAMIDGFIMRDPGSFEDIIDILLDEKVIEQKDADQFKRVLSLRKMLVQDYITISHEELLKNFTDNINAFKAYPNLVRQYLTNELGPVSAFKN